MNKNYNVVNIVPKKSIFEDEIRDRSSLNDFDFFNYAWNTGRYKRFVSFLKLTHLFFSKKHDIYCFHWVPFNWLFILLLFFKRNIVLYFWGGDYYGSIISTKEIERHCIRKTPRLREFQLLPDKHRNKYNIRKLRVVMACYVASRSIGIVTENKKYRYMRYCYWRFFKKSNFPERLDVKMYGSENIKKSKLLMDDFSEDSKNGLNILVCQNASNDLNVNHTALLIKELSKSFDINVYGFLSYSGGSEADRDRIECEYMELFSPFCKSVYFEREFLDYKDLDLVLRKIHIAVFSCYRDEGASLLRRFIMLGGVVSFNKFSINYSYFRVTCPEKLLSHDELTSMNSQRIVKLRQAQLKCNFSRPDFSVNLIKGRV